MFIKSLKRKFYKTFVVLEGTVGNGATEYLENKLKEHNVRYFKYRYNKSLPTYKFIIYDKDLERVRKEN